MEFAPIFEAAGRQFNVDPALAQAVMLAESGGNPSVISPKGAVGPMQLMPGTSKDMGVNPQDPTQNIMGGVKYLGQMLDKYGDVPTAVAAYNAGPGNVDMHRGIPPFPETQKYVGNVMSRYAQLSGQRGPQEDMPGLPPSEATAVPGVDPFAGMPAAATPAQTGGMVDPFAGLQTTRGGAAPKPAAAKAPNASPWDSLMRQVGLTARAGVTGISALPTMAGDAVNGAINLGIHGVNSLTGSHIAPMQMPSAVVQNAMNAAGVPQPTNSLERGVQDVSSAMAGVFPFFRSGQLLTQAASPMAQAVGKGMSALPGMQMTGAAGAALGGGIARDKGYGPVGQIVGGLVGGLGGALAPSAGLAAYRTGKGLVNNVAGAVQPVVNPQKYVGTQLAQTLGQDASTVAQNIRNAPEYVPGSQPTTAQAGANPVLVATEKSLANANPEFKIALANRSAENNAARWNVLNDVARTPQDLSDAIAARAAVTKPLYDAAHAQVVPVNDALVSLVNRPAMKQAMQAADTLAKNEGVPIQWPTPENPQISGKALDYTSRALGDLIGSAKSANNKELAKALTDAQSQLQNWMVQHVPGVREAASDYATWSSPVNTMQAGQQIAGSLGTRALDASGLPTMSLMPYRSALTKALSDQEFGIDPGAHKALQGIGQDIQRATISNSLRSPGSDTAYNLAANGWLARQIYGQNFGGATGLGRVLGALGATATGHPYIGAGLLMQGNKLGQLAGNRLNSELAELMLNPQGLLSYLDTVKPQQVPQALLPRLGRDVSQGLLGAATAERATP